MLYTTKHLKINQLLHFPVLIHIISRNVVKTITFLLLLCTNNPNTYYVSNAFPQCGHFSIFCGGKTGLMPQKGHFP